MPYRSRSVLTAWVTQFLTTNTIAGSIEVLLQDGSSGADTGLVVMHLRGLETQLWLEPVAAGEERFVVTIARPDGDASLDSLQLLMLSEELKSASALCDFLETKSRDHGGSVTPIGGPDRALSA